MMAEFEKQKHLYYQSIYQQSYSDGCASGRCWKQYKPTEISQMFGPSYCPTPKKPSPSSSIERDIL